MNAKLQVIATELLMELRGMAREELCRDEISYVSQKLHVVYTEGYLVGVNLGMGAACAPPACETCSDGGHGEGH
jgi:hypothetical protein